MIVHEPVLYSGSLAKYRAALFIKAIDEAAAAQADVDNIDQVRLDKAKASATSYRKEWVAAVSRELSLVLEVLALKRQLADLTGANIFPLRPQD